MADSSSCPEFDVLERFVAGELDGGSSRSIALHVESCQDCNQRLSDVAENLRFVPPIRALSRTTPPSAHAAAPERIGGYRVIREIGRGGMGIVYEAEQHHTQRIVALKVVRAGFASPESLRRFEHESRVLARLEHPGIARIYEAGTADTGRGPQPYFAMELVHGVNLREYVGRQPAGQAEPERAESRGAASSQDVRLRLELMANICDAVQHAHQKGVIHRDLKPANVLVNESGRPKVLDFGVARVTDSDLQATTLHTDIGQLVGTIPYMSPEQVSGDPNELDTRSDVYALGVVTYELLTGRLPYELNRRLIPEAVRIIREENPTPLSAAGKDFRGDVETIVSKALEKDKTRRYQSAAELAADIRRYLNDEPIQARPPSTMYQVRKFARRNRALVFGMAAVFVALIGGAIVSTWQAVRATRAEGLAGLRLEDARKAKTLAEMNEAEAKREADKFEAVNAFLRDMLASANPENAPNHPDITVREALGRAVAKLDEGSIVDQPEIEAAVRGTIGNTYRALNDFDPAGRQLRAAVELGRSITPEGSEDLSYALNKLARLEEDQGHYDSAEPLFREALAMRRLLHGEEHEDVAVILNNLGWLLVEKGEYDDAERLLREALTMRRKRLGDEHEAVANSLNNLGALMIHKNDYASAESLLRESLAMDRKLRGRLHPNVATTMNNLATVLNRLGKLDEAELLLRQSLSLRREMLGDEHPDIATGLNNLATLLKEKGALEEAERLYRDSLAMDRKLRGNRHPRLATTMQNLASLLKNKGELDEAEALHREALSIRRETLSPTHPDTLIATCGLARLLARQGNHAKAEPLFAEAVTGAKQGLPKGHWLTGVFLREHGVCLTSLERYNAAEEALLDSYEIIERARGARHQAAVSAIKALTDLYSKWNRPEKLAEYRAMLPLPHDAESAPP